MDDGRTVRRQNPFLDRRVLPLRTRDVFAISRRLGDEERSDFPGADFVAAGVRPDVAERVLGHAITGVEGIYNRHEYFEEKAHALKALAGLIEKIVNPPADNVLPLSNARAM